MLIERRTSDRWSTSLSAYHHLYWLPVKRRVTYKLCLSVHAAQVGRCPGYIADLVKPTTSSLPRRDRLRSVEGNCYELSSIRRKFDERAFSHAGPAAWNILLSHITATIDIETFETSLKIHLLKLAYSM